MFAEKLKQTRLERGFTLKALGARVNLAESTMSLYESGKREPDLATVQMLSNILNVTVDYLLGSTNDTTNPQSSINDIKFALFGNMDIDDDVMEEVKAYAKFVAQRKKKPHDSLPAAPAPHVIKEKEQPHKPKEKPHRYLMAAYGGDGIREVTDPDIIKYIQEELEGREWDEYKDDF